MDKELEKEIDEMSIREATGIAWQWVKRVKSFLKIHKVLKKAGGIETEVSRLRSEKDQLNEAIKVGDSTLAEVKADVELIEKFAVDKKNKVMEELNTSIASIREAYGTAVDALKVDEAESKTRHDGLMQELKEEEQGLRNRISVAHNELKRVTSKKTEIERLIGEVKTGA